ncbi:aspartate aminotransferase family protein [Nocardioides marmorisolisilvae]|uniref:Aspartate aminotransferase family protein n=1 Tax=Nocardioides marmorisolisilvae TaxID=1542737 RepID=A0A3N0DPP8_9ACTN|nr:aminotransferase class III-fold pyridoxal phosphate-dependent enzyme [Nocardioides marmorisolisilvae]RNL77605.1 aspartate aminotransferase family protein [Nocardioides marmorisolisilvae]
MTSTTEQPTRTGADLSPGFMWPPFSPPTNELDPNGLPILTSGEGVWLTGKDGTRYLDGVGALEAMAVGHGRTRLVEVAARQMQQLAFLDVFRYSSEPALELSEKLIELTPSGMKKVHFTPGGSEAVETALKLALQYHWVRGDKNRRKVVTRFGAYHGVTFGAMNCDGRYYATRNDIYLGDNRFGVVAEGPATGPGWGLGARYAAGAPEFAATIEREGAENIAAVIVDACATASGVAAAPPEDLVALRKLCDENGILLIVDEIITGFGRTGKMFAHELSGVTADFFTFSKALSSGYMPIGATVVHERVVDEIAAAERADRVFAHGHTYGGHPVACAVALENIKILQEEALPTRASLMGERLREGLRTLARHDSFVDARGVGMLTGLELFATDSEAGNFGSGVAACGWLRRELRDLGLVTLTVHPGTVFLLAPPLIIEPHEIDRIVEIFDEGLSRFEARR